MATRPGLNLRTTQRLAMTPEIRQGMALLAMPGAALAEELARQAEENPFLSLEMPTRGAAVSGRSAFEIASDTVAEIVDLGTHLRAQLGTLDLEADVARAARAITWALDDRGYLDTSVEQVADAAEVTPEVAQTALETVQRCDPPGVAALDLRDCLRLQLIAHGIDPRAASAGIDALEDISAGKWRAAVHSGALTLESAKRIGALLPTLTSVPAAPFDTPARTLTPDLAVSFAEDGTVRLTETKGLHPTLTLDARLQGEMREATETSPQLHAYARAGTQLIRALSFRSDTLLRVGAAIVAHQRGFLDPADTDEMAPLTRQTIAAELSLHPSTVGRAIAGKSLAWSGGTLPLSVFFPTQLGDAGPSAFTVQHRLAELVRAESPSAVLSDEALARQLQREGVDIARRTVAKYRGCLGIAPSHIRKRRKAKRGEDGPKGQD